MDEKNSQFLTQFTAANQKMIAKSVEGSSSLRRHEITRTYSLEEVQKIIESGSLEDLQELSRASYARNGLYKRILLYYATILKYSGILVPHPGFGKELSTPFIKKRYAAALQYLDDLNLPEQLTRITLQVLINGCYYGLITSLDKNGFRIMDLPPRYCRSRYRDLEGNDVIEFNVLYFYTFVDPDERALVLKAYPKIISSYYRKYKDGKVSTPWLKLPAEISVCFPFFDDGRPLFLSVIPATMQYDDAVDTDRERDLEEIRKILVQKIPHLTDGTLLFEPQEAEVMHNGAVGMLKSNKNISVLTTYADVDAIVSKTTSDNVNNSVEKMLQHVYSEAGVSVQLFSPTGSQALNTSITNDMALMMVLGNKYSRFIKYIVNYVFSNSNISFSYKILPISFYNQSEFISDTFKLAQSGYSFLLPVIASGIDQRDLVDLKSLENDVLDLTTVLIPLSSAYTHSKEDAIEDESKGGAPTKTVEEKQESTVVREESIVENEGGSNT